MSKMSGNPGTFVEKASRFEKIDLLFIGFLSWTFLGLASLVFFLLNQAFQATNDSDIFYQEDNASMKSEIKSDERVIFFLTTASFDPLKNQWEIPIHGWIFEPEENSIKRKVALFALAKVLGLESEDADTEVFKKRGRTFLVDNEGEKKISIHLGSTLHFAGESKSNGHFKNTFYLSSEEVDRDKKSENGTDWLYFQAITKENDERVFEGKILLAPPQGITVISDIDDTVKISEVLNRKALLKNTFLTEFQVVPRMPSFYRELQKDGAIFHFVSSSPWQLFSDLLEFLNKNEFPQATIHLKLFRVKDSTFFDLFASSEITKPKIIEPIMERFPERQFILIGDSGEKDPEIYTQLARKYPKQVIAIYIRDVTGENATALRYQKLFEGLSPSLWQIFTDPDEIIYQKK